MATDRATKYKAHFDSKQELRPIFTSLNGDNSWLLSFPRPTAERETTGRAYFHIVHDPWLNGPDVELSWLAHISLSTTPAVSNGVGVGKLVQKIESAAADAGVVPSPQIDTAEGTPPIDAIFINFHYNDHLHKPTLLTFNPSIPVFTTADGAPIIKSLRHFDTIVTYSDLNPDTFSGDWTTLHPSPLLPEYLTIFRVKGHRDLSFLSCLIWSPTQERHEAILYSPHGLHSSTPALQTLLHHSVPKFSTLALLHGLKESWTFNWQTAFGVASGMKLYEECGAKYWIKTHDDQLKYGALLWLLNVDVVRTVEWWLGQTKDGEGEVREEIKVEDVGNGECLVLV